MTKNSILERWLNRKKTTDTKLNAVPKHIKDLPIGESAPLSYGQQRLWFLQQLFPQNPFYHYVDVLRFKGILNVDVLTQSFQKIIERHDILRTTFLFKNDLGVQHVSSQMELEHSFFDISDQALNLRESIALDLALEISRQPFDLSKGPLFRIGIIQLTDREHFLVLSMHHIISDKWSMRILREELALIYQTLNSGLSPSLPKLEIQYADYAYLQRAKEIDSIHLDYWKSKLNGELSILNLPTDHPRPTHASYNGSLITKELSTELTNKLRILAKNSNTTLFVLLLSAFKVMLYRYTNQEDILIGTPFANRDEVELEKLVGFFNETLVLRSDLSGDPSFTSLVQKVRQTVLDAFSHKDTPFENLVKHLKPDRYISTNPLFQGMFLYHKVEPTPSFGDQLMLEHEPFDFGVSKFDLTLYISEEEDTIKTIFEYSTDLFEPETIERMQAHFKTMLEGIINDPDQRISRLPILSKNELKQQIVDWNDTEVTFPKIETIHEMIEGHVIRIPNETAVIDKDSQLTYTELDQKANRIAQHLQTLHVTPNTPIGLCCQRSIEMVIGIFGILKAGCAYVPLDPDYPIDRLQWMLDDSKAPIVLTQSQTADIFTNINSTIFSIDNILETQPSDTTILTENIGSDNLAYIIYTSGSTGRPKGVPVTHSNLIHSINARFDYYPDSPENFLLLSSLSFDSSIVGIFWTLSTGGCLVLPEFRIEQDMECLSTLISKYGITHTLLLPSLYSLLLQHGDAERMTSLKTIIVAGESCTSTLCKLHFGILPNVNLYNEYGPTEATVWCTVHHLSKEDAKRTIPIGKPIANTQIYVLDQNHQLVPQGATGEIFIGGAGVVKEYFNLQSLSTNRFVQNVFSTDVRSKLYRTGDLGRYRVDGLIEFLGRADRQVKIRGYRIELDEITEVLSQHPEIDEAVVFVHADDEKTSEDSWSKTIIEDKQTQQIIQLLQLLEPDQAEQLIESVETISENQLEYLFKD
ncbi:MAG: amino acid adenylation domain-containing protein [Saprospiraceae bacterium]